VPDEAKPLRVKLAGGQSGERGQSFLYILVRYLHACTAYPMLGMGLERPLRLNGLFSGMIDGRLRPVPQRVQRPERTEKPLEDLAQLRPWLTWTELTGAPRDLSGKRQELVKLIREYPRENIIRACATMSVLFNFGQEGNTTTDDELTPTWIPKLFRPDLVEKVKTEIVFETGCYSIAAGTTDQLMDAIPGSIERRKAIFSINSFCLPRVDTCARRRRRSLPGSLSL